MKKSFTALKNETWEEHKETFKEKMRASEWAFGKIKEAFDLVAKDEVEKMSIVQEITLKSTDYLRRIIALVGGQGGVTMSYLCPNCNSFPWKIMFGGSLLERSTPAGGVRFVAVQTGESVEQAKVFKAHAVSAPGLVRKYKQCVEVAGKPARIWTDGLRDFIKVDNHRALDGGELHRGTGTLKVGKPKAPS